MDDQKIEELKKCTKELTLLYVEDDHKIRDKFSSLFKMLFKEVYACENGKEGVALYETKNIDLVIADISMPEMDGLSMSKIIKEKNPDAIIIVTTAYSDTNYLLDAIDIGIYSYLIKPVETNKLINTLISAVVLQKAKKCITENLQLAEELKEKNRILDSINTNLESLVQQETKKRLEQERMLTQQSKMAAMGEMLNAITHQWRQPISVLYTIIGRYEMAQEDNGSVQQVGVDELFSVIRTQVEYMNQTVNDFKEFLKPTRLKKRFLLSKCIEETIAIFTPQASKYNITIGYQPRDEIEMVGFPNELKQAILNLLGNAKDAILERRNKLNDQKMAGKITLESYKSGSECHIVVCDNGGGIPEDLVQKIFEPFFSTKGEDGTGIGLVMVKNIIEGHFGGDLSVSNTTEGACLKMVCTLE